MLPLPRALQSPPQPPRVLSRMLEVQRRCTVTELRPRLGAAVDPEERDRAKRRPHAVAIATQRWNATLMLHWPVPTRAIRPLVDPRLGIDEHDGTAWVSITPFTVVAGRMRGLPGLPAFHELGVRTYVHRGGRYPGVWVLSLDASSLLAVFGARTLLGLPYFWCRAARHQAGGAQAFQCVRHRSRGRARFQAVWEPRGVERQPEPGSLDDFLLGRFRLYSAHYGGRLLCQAIHHEPWRVQGTRSCDVEETLSAQCGLPKLGRCALAHFTQRQMDVEVFLPEAA
jgi:uncharacterized protein